MSPRNSTYWGDPPSKPVAREEPPMPPYLYTTIYVALVCVGMLVLMLLQTVGVLH